ncbi:MAG: hypothetical protein IPN92_07185 [Chromatiaceae bacterium]|nr:hypothetical protein [Chromatiaceae bacterium]
MSDAILNELWEIKDRIASEHNYDLDQLVDDLRRKSDARDVKQATRIFMLHDQGVESCDQSSSPAGAR